ncbi:hypothetical protein [Zunongwangia sp. H14]|uniref:hypothetical protein n=1 Tax=Zunongwangia sp. H14 TaxID=3240792 RepID=UPI0035666F4B
MKVFLPFQQEGNPYLEEIIAYSNCEFTYANISEYSSDFSIVNIHWPEAIFNWFEPSSEELSDLERRILEWKKHSLIFYTKHDFSRIKGTTNNYQELFRIVESNADVFIHLGNYSKEKYELIYPKAHHKVVYHPLYRNSFPFFKQEEARRKLGISKEALVIIAPGQIRFHKERDLILNAFKMVQAPEKVLIATNMRAELRYDFPGRTRLKKIIDVKNFLITHFKSKYQSPEYIFNYGRLSYNEFGLHMAAADIVFIPRINILNSGNIFMGLTYDKIVLGPCTGNLKEQLEELGFPIFDPKNKVSVINALKDAINLNKANYQINRNILSKYEPASIAAIYDKLFVDMK